MYVKRCIKLGNAKSQHPGVQFFNKKRPVFHLEGGALICFLVALFQLRRCTNRPLRSFGSNQVDLGGMI